MCIVCQSVMSVAAVIASVVPAVSESPTASIADTRCARQATSRSVGGVTYVCRPVGKVLRWKRVAKAGAVTGTSTVTTSTTSTTTTTTTTIEPYRVPTLASSLPDLCRLRDQSMQRRTYGQLVAGFPVIERNFAAKGTFTLALIPIDFADVPGDSAVLSRVADQMRLVSDWYDMVSDGRVRIEWKVHQSWLRVPGTSADYTMSRSRSNDNFLANAAFAAADPVFDFSAVRAVAFVLPKGQTFMAEGVQGFKHSEFGSNGGYLTNEGRIENYMIAGAYFERQWKNFWSYWAHEMGHMFPLPDLYDQNQQWWMNPTNRQFEVPGGPFSGFDIMANQDGPSRTLSAWLRFVMGWLSDEQIFCKPLTELTTTRVMLVPIDDRVNGVKAAMIPVSSTKLIVVESRRPNEKFDCEGTGTASTTWRARRGVIVYTADMTLGHGEGFQALIAPAGRGLQTPPNCSAPQQLDAVLNVDDFVEVNGVRIRVISSNRYDVVEIVRL
ncbi:MAG: hypothetical protein RL574_518 [Actinomycetota bacterium]